MLAADLFSANVDFHGDLLRNIPGVRRSQQLFDDLSADPADWEVAIAAEGTRRTETPAALITRPFDYGIVVGYTFDAPHWHATRFSEGTRYGVWYGALDVRTTVYETAWHWYRFVQDSFAGEKREIVTDRRVFDVRCDALLVDLRGKERAYPALTSRTSYAFTHQVGRYVHEQGLNGVLIRSARCDGTNGAIFKPERLCNVRHKAYLTYRLDQAAGQLTVERTPGRKWLRFAPAELG
jgi:hypothetical protein